MQVDLVKSFQFEAAHRTPRGAEPERLHGHSYRVEICVGGTCDPHLGWLVDYAEIADRFQPLYKQLDHFLLNEVTGLGDVTVDGVSAWITERLSPSLPKLRKVRVGIVGAPEYEVNRIPIDEHLGLPHRVRFGFEAAHALPHLPRTHKCFRMHGHSFIAEVGARDLDALTPPLRRVYDALDHRCLNDIAGLENPTSEVVSRWIWQALADTGVEPEAVVVAETCTAKCIYRGN